MGVVRGDNSLFFATGIDNSGLQKGSLNAVGLIQNMSSKIARINPFAALAIGAVAAFTAISVSAFKMSKNFEHAMKEVETISDAAQKNLQGISKSVFELSKITPDGPDKLAEAFYQIVSAGHDGEEGLKLLEIAAKAAVGGVTETAIAADGITTVLNAFKIEAKDSEKVADILFKTVQLGKTTFSELASNISTVAPIAAASGISFEQVAAAIASLTKQGVPTAQAMTQIRSAIIGTNEALGDGWSKAMTLQEAFQLLFEKANGSQTALQELVGRVEAVSGVLGVAGRNAKGAAKDLDAMAAAAGSSNDAFKIMASSNINQWDILRNRIKATTKGIGDVVLEMSNGIARSLNNMLEPNRSLVEGYREHQKVINDLVFEYRDGNTSLERRKEILVELKKINPAIVGGLGTEKSGYVLLNEQLEQYNILLSKRISLEEELNKKNDLKNKKSNIESGIVKLEARARDFLEKFNNGLASGQNKLTDTFKKQFDDILADSTKNYVDKLNDLTNVIRANERSVNSSKFSANNLFLSQVGKELPISATVEGINRLKQGLKDVNGELNLIDKEIQNKLLISLKNSPDLVLTLLDAYKDLDKVSKELGVNVELIDDSKVKKEVQKIKDINAEIEKINAITKEQYKNNNNILKEALASEIKQIAEAAEKRKAFFEFKPTDGNKDDRTDIERFKDRLKESEEQYKAFNLAVINNEKELAKKLKAQYKLKEDDYITYLRKLFTETEDVFKKIEILSALGGVSLTPREAVLDAVSEIKPEPIVLDIKLDTTSINFIERQIQQLEEKRKAALTQTERDLLQIKIDALQKRLDIANDSLNKEEDLYKNLTRSLNDLNNKELRDYIEYWQKKLVIAKKGSEAAAEAEGNIDSASQQIGQNTLETISQISSVLNEASSLFRKFGDEDMAKLLDQLSGVAQGVGSIVKGALTGNPLDIIQGSLQVLNSALSVEIVSDTAKFEAEIKKLEKAIEKLDYVISKSIGRERISSRTQAIEALKELEKQADLAKEAELKARKEVKFLGISIAKKGNGSGTSAEKLEEIEQKAEDARRKAVELREQLDELYTGTTERTIVDSIISGLREGKKTVADFADNFKTLMQDAMLQAFQIQFLEEEIQKFYDAFSSAGSDGNFTANEIEALQALYNQIVDGAQNDIDAINAILEETGIGALGTDPTEAQQGLQGALRRQMTEETAGELTGLFRNQLDVTRNHLEVSQQHLSITNNIAEYSERIANNTFETVERLTKVMSILESIDSNVEKSYLLDLGG